MIAVLFLLLPRPLFDFGGHAVLGEDAKRQLPVVLLHGVSEVRAWSMASVGMHVRPGDRPIRVVAVKASVEHFRKSCRPRGGRLCATGEVSDEAMRIERRRITDRHRGHVFESAVIAVSCCLALVACSPSHSFKTDEPTGAATARASSAGESTAPTTESPEKPVPSSPSRSQRPLNTAKLVGTWEISPGSASENYYSLEIEKDGAASTVGEPLAVRDSMEAFRICGGTAHLKSTPVKMTLTCANAETDEDGRYVHMRRHAGMLHLGRPPSITEDYGDEVLIIDWVNGKTDYLFPGNI
ncbi:hypothetical protein [Streptomyces sp. NPDC096105]|uniref:hypothetical protein n=1 Tax=Streptomyces sp. NPDC096105 TaxID=3366074 RepID=UPI0037F24A4B